MRPPVRTRRVLMSLSALALALVASWSLPAFGNEAPVAMDDFFAAPPSSPVTTVTSQNFSGPGTPYTLTRHDTGPGPSITGGAVRLTSNSYHQVNAIVFDRTAQGLFPDLRAEFDFRFTDTSGGGADGFGFVLLNTATFGTTGAAPGFTGPTENPSYDASLGIGFDIWWNSGEVNDNHVSLHWDGAQVAEVDLDLLGFDLEGAWTHGAVTVVCAPGGSLVTLVLTRGTDTVTPLADHFVPGLTPYEYRPGFIARTGFVACTTDIDNIVIEHGPGSIAVGNVLANDTDPDGQTLTAVPVDPPSHGTVDLAADGTFVYRPDESFTGIDSFTYKAFDGTDESNVATVTLGVGVNLPPVADPEDYGAVADSVLTVPAPGVLGNDSDPNGDPMTAVLVSNAAHGTVDLAGDGSFTYIPDQGFAGQDGFTYKASDGTQDSAVVTVTLHVADLDQWLVAHWAFDEGSGTTAHDSSPSEYHGTLTNGPAWAGGVFGGALSFNGSDDYVDVPAAPNLTNTSFTLTAWVKHQGSGDRSILSKWRDQSTSYQVHLQVFRDNKAWFAVMQPDGTQRTAQGTTPVPAGEWHHIAAVADTATSELRLYLDGQPEKLQATPNWNGAVRDLDMAMNIGRKSTGDQLWNGQLDDVRIYDRALTGAEIVEVAIGRDPAIIYVDQDATGANNGTSWADAFTDLQSGLAAAWPGDQIWVAEGTYKPTGGTDRSASFRLKEDVAVYGGFDATETALEQRDPATHVTILSADIGTEDDASDNSYHVVRATAIAGATLDGFTITGGNANAADPDDRGGGIYCDSASPTITNCAFYENAATSGGGGLWSEDSSPQVSHSTFAQNATGGGGGAVRCYGGSPSFTQCGFSNNQGSSGGAANGNENVALTFADCTFSNNTASEYGGAFFGYQTSPTFTDCTFTANSATTQSGGAVRFNKRTPGGSNAVLTRCTFTGNSCATEGGAVYDRGGACAAMTDCRFVSNTAAYGGGAYTRRAVVVPAMHLPGQHDHPVGRRHLLRRLQSTDHQLHLLQQHQRHPSRQWVRPRHQELHPLEHGGGPHQRRHGHLLVHQGRQCRHGQLLHRPAVRRSRQRRLPSEVQGGAVGAWGLGR